MSELPPAERCPICGGDAVLTSEVRPMKVIDYTVEVLDEFYRCSHCREELYRPGMLDPVLRRAVAAVPDGDLTPAIRAFRQRLGMGED